MNIKRLACITLAGLTFLSVTANADNLRLKNGTVVKGKVVSFSGGAFTVALDLGSSSQSRAIIDMRDVESIEFDDRDTSTSSAVPRPSAPDDDYGHRPSNNNSKPIITNNNKSITTGTSTNNATKPTTTQTQTASNNNRPAQPKSQPPYKDDPEPLPQPPRTQPGTQPGTQPSQTIPVSPTVQPALNDTTSNAKDTLAIVPAREDWTFTNVVVKRGDKIHLSASGKVKISPTKEAGPEGITLEDKDRLLLDRPTGSLIAVIGDDNDDFIFVGRESNFVAARDGKLFLSINEGNLNDNSGSFSVRVNVEKGR